VSGGKTLGVRLLQVALSICSTWWVYRIGRRTWGATTGLIGATLVAFYPSQVAFSHLLWSETLYGFLLLVALDRALTAVDRGTVGPAAVAGLALGAAALTRSLGLAVALATIGWMLWERRDRQGVRMALVLGAGLLVVVLPWSISASRQAGRFVTIDTNAGFNLWSGNNERIPAGLQGLWTVGLRPHNGLDPAVVRFLPDDGWRGEAAARLRAAGIDDVFGPQADLWYQGQARAEIRARPGRFLARAPKKIAALWAPDFFLPRHLVRDWYGPLPRSPVVLLVLLTWAAAAVALIGGPAALGLSAGSRLRSISIVWIVVYLSIHAVVYGHSRMHQPLIPLLLLAVAGAIGGRPETLQPSRLLRRGLPWAALALASWILIWPALGGQYLLPGPRHAAIARGLAVVRALPLPATDRLGWMLATVEASNGRIERADRILRERAHADDPWSLYLRATIARSAGERISLLESAVRSDPGLFAAWVLLAETRAAATDPDGARQAMARAAALRPWDRLRR
jgi:4-amino-4-deoxy-L-arabinose transferase-like glycosyltransferase